MPQRRNYMKTSFEDELMSLIDKYSEAGTDRDEIMSGLELRLIAMREEDEALAEEGEQEGDA